MDVAGASDPWVGQWEPALEVCPCRARQPGPRRVTPRGAAGSCWWNPAWKVPKYVAFSGPLTEGT